ncbi:methyl-accepting chemotaxis protein [Bacillus sp. JJ1764]|uniref:methyl-accepting chemotaxis protein n=1 Tax=Bacillus sp. JJ1764 TaxID=3122964 RepID=UPI002FFE03AA
MLGNFKWSNIKIGGKYLVIFLFITVTFLIAIFITGAFIHGTSGDMDETVQKNNVAKYSSDLVTLFDEKYLLIPEYLLLSDDRKLNEYLDLSKQYTVTAKKLKKNLSKDQLSTFNQMVENNHKLDEYFFSTIVPKVQDIDTSEFKVLQQSANELKTETGKLGYDLKNSATKLSNEKMDQAKENLGRLITILIISVISSIAISISLLYVMSRKISKNLNQIVLRSNDIASGQLNNENLAYQGKDEIGQLSESINVMSQSLSEMISEISTVSKDVDRQIITLFESSKEVKTGGQEIAISIQEMANGSTIQARNASNISQKTMEFNENILSASEQGEKLVRFSDEVLQAAIIGDKQMKQSLEQMHVINNVVENSVDQVRGLESKTESITEIVHVIKSISDQTNLLALNASIEAARAGEAGKSFAVVATEVRKLAEEVSNSVEGISKIIFSIKEETSKIAENLQNGYTEVSKGSQQIENTGQQFTEINDKVSQMSTWVKLISETLTKFKQSSTEINDNIVDIAAISEESAAASEEISAAVSQQTASLDMISGSTKNLTDMVERMNALINRFKL